MTFVVQRIEGRAAVLSQFETDVLRIGRGTNCELRSENPAVGLLHAQIELSAAGYTIVDKGSVTGTYVNRRPAESAVLSKGDTVEIGDLIIEVELADPAKPMFLRMTTQSQAAATQDSEEAVAEEIAAPAGGAIKAQRVDYGLAYRLRRSYLTKRAVTCLLLIVTLAVIGEIALPERQPMFMPGGVSSAHSRARDVKDQPIAKNCGACHDPWHGISEAKCKSCHGRAPHAERELTPPSCTSCHAEHRAQAKLAMVPDLKCTTCHADLTRHIAGSEPPRIPVRITGFGLEHPEFKPIADVDTLRFNHKLHLRKNGILNGRGQREVLTCAQCHKLTDTRGKVDPAPLRFTAACQRCHTLTFDLRFPDAEVPHGGDPGLVYGYIVTTYAGNREIAGKSPEEIRRILTTRPPSTVDERAVLNAEQVIKTKCQLCHQIERRGTRLAAIVPVLPQTWLQRAAFTHTSHANIDCERCHDRARNSTATADVLIPSQNVCVSCHGPQSVKIPTSCVTCHVYHVRSRLLRTRAAVGGPGSAPAMSPTGDLTGMLQTVLLYTIVILMLVILIPVALALFTRLRAPKGPATPPLPPVPTTRVRAASPAPAAPAPAQKPQPAAAPTAAPSPKVESTRLIDVPQDQPSAPAGPEATAMVEWYGMLTCTSGPLEGQRFIIEEEGLWIGRDPQLAQIVINDSRISKRHVRIVPRNGRAHAIDVESTNGTFIDQVGERITDVQLKKGNTIILADNAASFLYQL